MDKTDERIKNLENRIAALELALKDGKKNLDEIVDTWQAVILQFAKDYNIDCPKLKLINGTSQERNNSFDLT